MKGIMGIICLISLIAVTSIASAQTAGGMIPWEFEGYTVEVHSQPQNIPQLADIFPFIAAQIGMEDWFGLRFGGVDPDTFWIYELYDDETDRVIKRITLAEMVGMERENGCRMILDDQVNPTEIITHYEILKGDYRLIFKRTISLLDDPNLPGGKRIVMTYSVENKNPEPVMLRLTERWGHDDVAIVEGDRSILTINKGKEHDGFPILVQTFDGQIEEIKVEKAEGRGVTVTVTVHKAVKVERTYAKPTTYLGAISLGVATTEDPDYSLEQAKNIAEYLATGNPKPVLVVETSLDRWEALPGEEVTYTLNCFNNGTGRAVNGAVIQPMPSMVQYLPGSAKGEGTKISYSVDGGQTFQEEVEDETAVTHIRWEIPGPLSPGESIELSFKAKVKGGRAEE
ncbi:TPA: DUF11 domain-containing protein [Candidatus Poribacteria bacterium]|nr:DUF11 domain-containing protein [Candidatus Poribacteria bacterium]